MDAKGVDALRKLGDQKGGIACEVGQSSADGEAENRGIFIRLKSTGMVSHAFGWVLEDRERGK